MIYEKAFYLKSNKETLCFLKKRISCGELNKLDSNSESLLGVAIRYRRYDAIEYLLENEADANQKSSDNYPIEIASMLPDNYIIDLLIKNGAKIQIDNHSLSIAIAARADSDIVNRLLSIGADPNDYYDDENALWWAIQAMNIDVLKLLLDKGANIDIIDANNATCLIQAIGSAFMPGIKMLIQYGADVNLLQPLHMAATWFFPAVKLLLDNGADINAVDDDGRTVLFIERIRGNLDNCDYFIKNGANPNIKDNLGIDYFMLNDPKLREQINAENGYC